MKMEKISAKNQNIHILTKLKYGQSVKMVVLISVSIFSFCCAFCSFQGPLFVRHHGGLHQETLEKVIQSKKTEYNQNKPTEIVCHIFHFGYLDMGCCSRVFSFKGVALLYQNVFIFFDLSVVAPILYWTVHVRCK